MNKIIISIFSTLLLVLFTLSSSFAKVDCKINYKIIDGPSACSLYKSLPKNDVPTSNYKVYPYSGYNYKNFSDILVCLMNINDKTDCACRFDLVDVGYSEYWWIYYSINAEENCETKVEVLSMNPSIAHITCLKKLGNFSIESYLKDNSRGDGGSFRINVEDCSCFAGAGYY